MPFGFGNPFAAGGMFAGAFKPPQGSGGVGPGGGFGFGGGGSSFLPMMLSSAGQNLSARAGPQIPGQAPPQPQGGGMFGGMGGMNPMMMQAMMSGGGMGGGMGLPPQVLDMLTRQGQGGAGQNVYGPQPQPSWFNRVFTPPPAGGYR